MTEKKIGEMSLKKLFFLFIVICVAGYLRLSNFTQNPPALYYDEVDAGYQAYSLLKTGKDYFGSKWPVSFHSLADFKAPFLIYFQAASIGLFGLNEVGVRLPSVFFGLLSIVVFFLFLFQVSRKNYWLSLIGTFVLSILPWHFHYSRIAFEVISMFFCLTTGFWLFFSAVLKKRGLLLFFSLLFFSLSIYAYATARLFLLLIGLLTFLIYRREIIDFGFKKLLFCFLGVLIILTPFLIDLPKNIHRFSYINIFSDSNLKYEIDRERLIDSSFQKEKEVGMKATLISKIFHNKPLSWGLTAGKNYFNSFSFSFLFLSGDKNLRHNVLGFGQIQLIFLPFLVIGLFKLFEIIKNKERLNLISQKEAFFLLVFLLISPIPSSITYEGGTHATRLFLMILPLVCLISLGIYEFLDWFKPKIKIYIGFLLVIPIILNSIYYFHYYFIHYPIVSEKDWDYGFKEGIKYIKENGGKYEKIVITDSYQTQPLIYFLFWFQYNPKEFSFNNYHKQDLGWFGGNVLGKYYFGHVDFSVLENNLLKLAKNNGDEKILMLAGRYDFGKDLNKETPSYISVLKEIRFPSGEPVLYVLEVRSN